MADRRETGSPRMAGAANLAIAAAIAGTIAALLPQDDRPSSSPVVFVEAAGVAPPAALSAPPAAADSREVRITFAGDIMQHASQSKDSFEASYAKIAPLLAKSDLVVGNLEFPVVAGKPAGPDEGSVKFNGSPAHLDALKNAGFDLLATANNHAFDQGVDGIFSTIDELERRGLRYAGTAKSKSALDEQLVIYDLDGIRVAFLAYTGILNTYLKDAFEFDDPPADLPVAFADFAEWDGEYRTREIQALRRRVQGARDAGADLVVALAHWGDEWNFAPNDDQRRAAHDLVGAGFDLVVGGHGHVLNSPEIFDGRLIVYSLGNLICDFVEWQARTGALLDVVVRKSPGDGAGVVGYAMHPLLIRRAGHVVEPLDPSARAAGGETALAWNLALRMLGASIAPATNEKAAESATNGGTY